MGMFGDLFGGLGDIYRGIQGDKSAQRAGADARRNKVQFEQDQADQRRRQRMIDFDPAYASEGVGDYRRSESPAARAYLESLLTGDNPQAAASPWASAGQKATAQNSFGQRYGSTEGMLARGKAHRAETPWAVTTPGPVNDSAVDMPTAKERLAAYNAKYDRENPQGESAKTRPRTTVERWFKG